MPQGPIPVFSQYAGGNKSALNLTAASVVKSTNGILYRIAVDTAGSTGGAFTFNDANALVTAQTITAITLGATTTITLSSSGSTNPFAVGNTIAFAGVGGTTALNTLTSTVSAIGGVTTAWTVTFPINSTNFTAWTSGGTAASFSAQNQFFTLPYNAAADVAGGVFTVDWPCLNGILLSAVPTGGGAIAVSYF